jgi:hypothetical protein
MTKVYSKKRNFNKKLWFLHGYVGNFNYYMSIVFGEVYKTLKFSETCLYDFDEVQKVIEAFKNKGIKVNVELATSFTLPPKNFDLGNPKLNNIYATK